MNKAFVREAEDTGEQNCPQCGSRGYVVQPQTLAAHLNAEQHKGLAEVAYFCPHPRCAVGYFDAIARTIPAANIAGMTWPKDPTGPLCNCFGFTLDDLDADLAEGGVVRVKAHLARAGSAEARCLTAAPDGRSCVAEVQRCYMRRRSEGGQ
jgi:hypothetical protein